MALARLAVQDVAVKAALSTAARAQGYGICPGARSPIGPARRPAELVEIVGARGDHRKERLTPLGYRTARERLPRALAVLEVGDHRLVAAMRYRHLVEAVAAVGGGEWLAGGGSGRISDGGAVHRTAIASELRDCSGVLGGTALVRGNARGERRDISLRALVDGVVLQGSEIKGVLRAHGWAGMSYVKPLTDALLDALSRMSKAQEPY
ncbi:MAG: hypothetical protein QM699_07655 [Amaricoccus sp.]|uniref:hypothetical protein n=1 Tax=Amaricoccus sp. TaxID=1872485 RepID=UPI0039E32A09